LISGIESVGKRGRGKYIPSHLGSMIIVRNISSALNFERIEGEGRKGRKEGRRTDDFGHETNY